MHLEGVYWLKTLEEAKAKKESLNKHQLLLHNQLEQLHKEAVEQASKPCTDDDLFNKFREFYRNSAKIELYGQPTKSSHPTRNDTPTNRAKIDAHFNKVLGLTPALLDFIKNYVTLNFFSSFPKEIIKTQKVGERIITNYLLAHMDNVHEVTINGEKVPQNVKKETSTYSLTQVPEENGVIFNCEYMLSDTKLNTSELAAKVAILIQEVDGKIITTILSYSDNYEQWLALHPSPPSLQEKRATIDLTDTANNVITLSADNRRLIPHPLFQKTPETETAVTENKAQSLLSSKKFLPGRS